MCQAPLTRLFPLLCGAFLAGCNVTPGASIIDFRNPAEMQGTVERGGAVELAVKSNLPAVLADIAAGGGEALTAAFDAAYVPPSDRAARVTQLQGDLPLYRANPGALVTALLLYGG